MTDSYVFRQIRLNGVNNDTARKKSRKKSGKKLKGEKNVETEKIERKI